MSNYILIPPIAFLLLLVVFIVFSRLSSFMGVRGLKVPGGKTKPYACGEDVPSGSIHPDYSQFFPFAFFFTIMHVVALMLTTIPAETIRSGGIVFIYIIGAVIGLFILFRR